MFRGGVRAPFRPPRRIGTNDISARSSSGGDTGDEDASKSKVKRNIKLNEEVSPKKPRLDTTSNEESKAYNRSEASNGISGTYIVQWRMKSNKKNKTWAGDGLLRINASKMVLSIQGKTEKSMKEVASSTRIQIEGIISIGMYEIIVDCKDDVCKEEMLVQNSSSGIVRRKFKQHRTHNASSGYLEPSSIRTPLYEPTSPGSLVMPPPPNKGIGEYVDVVIDPKLAQVLRPHQKEAVEFLYSCVMGYKDPSFNGALLADDMGLGKTLTTIALIWTLLKQSPYLSDNNPICKKVLVVCPVTLIGNWLKEFKKWLDLNRIGVLALNSKQNSVQDKKDITSFGKTKIYQVLIMGYEKVLSCREELLTLGFDLLVCDEGHRLKNSSNKVMRVLNELDIHRKVLLTGTPIQNDLSEYFTIINFVNPNSLGTFASFQKNFMKPILRGRDVNCKNKQIIATGEEKSNELISLTKGFIMRRTSDILSHYLPPRTEVILFCPPTDTQKKFYDMILKSLGLLTSCDLTSYSNSLPLITLLRKVSNSPSLIIDDPDFQRVRDNMELSKDDKTLSGKVKLLIPLLLEIRKLDEKVVLVSNFTQTLDLLQSIVTKLNLKYLRLDGTTPVIKRDKIINDFNRLGCAEASIFLLSAKTGGVGLNLVGASRLILFDNDWNPSVDLQAMARIHRYGQTKPVFIYRFLTTGTIDEKIFQRQAMKNNLSDKFLGDSDDSVSNIFKLGDLKDLFRVHDCTTCNTHDLLSCACKGEGGNSITNVDPVSDDESDESDESNVSSDWVSALDFKISIQSEKKEVKTIKHALQGYKHYDPRLGVSRLNIDDFATKEILHNFQKEGETAPISYIFIKVTNKKT